MLRPSIAGSGVLGLVSSTLMVCPLCSGLAVPFLGAGGLLGFLRPDAITRW